jgi:glutamate synthase domain-containing protein 1
MCAITGFLDKTGARDAPIGKHLLRMLLAVGCRGPDSAGIAVFGPNPGGYILRIKIGEGGDLSDRAERIVVTAREHTSLQETARNGDYLRLIVSTLPENLIDTIERVAPDVEVVSAGRSLEIVKQVGSPAELAATFGVANWVGTHGIGHTRLSTESKIDLSHSQPFGAHGYPDLATVHNGHITNYHILRRKYEQRGVRFYTENDSEIIGVYLRDRIESGLSFAEALKASLSDFDGSFCYLAATAEAFAFVKDPFAFKPLMIAETDEWVAISTEEIALRRALGEGFVVREPKAKCVQVWEVPMKEQVAA